MEHVIYLITKILTHPIFNNFSLVLMEGYIVYFNFLIYIKSFKIPTEEKNISEDLLSDNTE